MSELKHNTLKLLRAKRKQCKYCDKEYTSKSKLECKHNICLACLNKNDKKCPVRGCRKLIASASGKTKQKKAHGDKSELSSFASLKEHAHALGKKYQSELFRRENECIQRTEQLETCVKELHEEEQRQLDDLKNVYNFRFDKLKQQLNTEATFKYFTSLEKENDIDEKSVKDIEQKTQEIETQTLEVDVPQLNVEIEQSDDDWLPESIVTIDAPPPTAQLTPPPRLSIAPKLSSLLDKTLLKEKDVSTQGLPLALHVINNKLYSCESSAGLSIYSMDLIPDGTIPTGDMGDVNAVTALEDDSLLVAASQGLFTITNNDKASKVADGLYTRVHYRDGKVYALNDNDEITIYNLDNDELVEPQTITLPHNCNTFVLGSDIIYASDSNSNHVYMVSEETGEQPARYGSEDKEDLDHLDHPYCTQTGAADDVLVCDSRNHCLKIMRKDGSFHVISTDVEVDYPVSAVFVHKTLYVGSFSEKKIYKFSV